MRNESEAKRSERERLKRKASPNTVTKDDIVRKLKPLWLKGLIAAERDIQGIVNHLINNRAYERAKQKISLLNRLEIEQYELENDPNAVPSLVSKAVNEALTLAAHHFYPNGDFEGLPSETIVQDIGRGDTKKLVAVIGYFKLALLRPRGGHY